MSRADLVLLAANAVYGTSYVAMRFAIDDVGPVTLAFLRLAIASAILVPVCLASRCTVFDVRAQPLSACSVDSECKLVPSDCCACGDAFIAVRSGSETALTDTVCNPDRTCPPCEPKAPVGIEAFCAGDGHCAVRSRRSPGRVWGTEGAHQFRDRT